MHSRTYNPADQKYLGLLKKFQSKEGRVEWLKPTYEKERTTYAIFDRSVTDT